MQKNEKFKNLVDLIEKDIRLPSPPAIAVRILNSVRKDDTALAELGNIITADPALTVKMLRLANSGIFARNGEISNINRAMAILGTNMIKNIALSFIIAEDFSKADDSDFDGETFWRHSVTAAVAAELIAQKIGHLNDDIFVASLLQNIGMLVLAMAKSDDYRVLLNNATISGTDISHLEQDRYGFSHEQVANILLLNWRLANTISEPILYHHHPDEAPEDQRQAAEILYCAHQMATICTSRNSAEKARILQQQLQLRFNLNQQDSLELLDTVALNSREMLASFELNPGDIRPYSALLQEANSELSKLNLSSEQLILELKEAKERAEKLSTQLQDANTRLKELVYRDGLTGLYNHRYFQEALADELARSRRYKSSLSLILFDIDHFKKVNDTYGHPAGDMVLMNIARAVSSAVRPSDVVARYGGEEFAVILPETNLAGAKVFAARLRRCVEGIATLVDGQLIYVTISSGATSYCCGRAPGNTYEMIEVADRGLYTSKQNGRNQVTTIELERSES